MKFPRFRNMFKAVVLAFVIIPLSSVALGVSLNEQLTPKNIGEQSFRFTIVSGKEGNRPTFKITVESKEGRQFPEKVSALLTVIEGKKRIVDVPIDQVRTANGVTFSTIYLSAGCLPSSMVFFGVENGGFGGSGWWFYLKDFVDKK